MPQNADAQVKEVLRAISSQTVELSAQLDREQTRLSSQIAVMQVQLNDAIEKLDRLHTAHHGNGVPGLKHEVRQHTTYFKILFWVCGVALATFIGSHVKSWVTETNQPEGKTTHATQADHRRSSS